MIARDRHLTRVADAVIEAAFLPSKKASWTSGSKWTILSGRALVVQRQVFLTVDGARRWLARLSERTFFLLSSNARGKAWLSQAANVPIADTFLIPPTL